MAKSKRSSSYWGEMLKFGLHKRNQGRRTRQLTAVAVVLVIFFGTWTLSQGPLSDYDSPFITFGIPMALAALGVWFSFRLVNVPRFADFLISVEAEMDKVSWASRGELYRATIVVVGTMFFVGFLLFCFDVFWQWFFTAIGFLRS